MEYLFIVQLVSGYEQCYDIILTDLMKSFMCEKFGSSELRAVTETIAVKARGVTSAPLTGLESIWLTQTINVAKASGTEVRHFAEGENQALPGRRLFDIGDFTGRRVSVIEELAGIRITENMELVRLMKEAFFRSPDHGNQLCAYVVKSLGTFYSDALARFGPSYLICLLAVNGSGHFYVGFTEGVDRPAIFLFVLPRDRFGNFA